VDSGSLGAPNIVASHDDHGVELRGPARPDDQWQARARNGFALDDFRLDWEGERAACPAGRTSSSWRRRPDATGRPLIWVRFSSKDCAPCPSRPACCRAQGRTPRRTRSRARAPNSRRSGPPVGASRPPHRAGRLRAAPGSRAPSSRYPEVQLGHILAAAGLIFLRLGEWFAGTQRRKPQRSPFARLLAGPVAA